MNLINSSQDSITDAELNKLSDQIQANPMDPEAWYNMGSAIDILSDDAEEATSYYRSAVSLAPFNPKYHKAWVTCLIDSEDRDGAMAALEAATDLLRDTEAETLGQDTEELYAECILHCLHQTDLSTARYIIDKLHSAKIAKNSALLTLIFAYAELRAIDQESRAGLVIKKPLVYVSKLPATRLNPARYYRGKV